MSEDTKALWDQCNRTKERAIRTEEKTKGLESRLEKLERHVEDEIRRLDDRQMNLDTNLQAEIKELERRILGELKSARQGMENLVKEVQAENSIKGDVATHLQELTTAINKREPVQASKLSDEVRNPRNVAVGAMVAVIYGLIEVVKYMAGNGGA